MLIAALLAASADAAGDQLLHYVEKETTLELTVPGGGVWLIIPREGFERLRPVESGAPGSRSFDLVNEARGIEILGAFDSASRHPGLKRLWAQELEALKLEEALEPPNVRFTTEGKWDVILYETVRDGSRTSHVRAEVVKDQVWIDVHVEVSALGDVEAQREMALNVPRSLAYREELGGAARKRIAPRREFAPAGSHSPSSNALMPRMARSRRGLVRRS